MTAAGALHQSIISLNLKQPPSARDRYRDGNMRILLVFRKKRLYEIIKSFG